MSEMNPDRLHLLECIARFDGRANWYKLGRIALGELSSPGRFTEELRWLIDHAFVEEREPDETRGETLPSLSLTPRGREVLMVRAAG